MKPSTQFENLSTTGRVLRFVVSAIAVVVAIETNLAGTPVFAAISLLAIALSISAIVGWGPLKALVTSTTRSSSNQYKMSYPGHSA